MNRMNFIFVLLLTNIGIAGSVFAQEFSVIVNKQLNIDSMGKEAIKTHYLKKSQTFSDGTKILPVDYASNSSIREAFLSVVLDMSPDDVDRYWIETSYANGIKPPKKVGAENEVLSLVSTNKGAIGFVKTSTLDGEALKTVTPVFKFNM